MAKLKTRPKSRRTPRDQQSRKGEEAPPTGSPVPAPDVMTIEQLAVYLSLAVPTLYKKVQAHEIPFTKVGNLLRFTKVSIDRWLSRNTTTPDEDLYHQFARLQSRYHFQTWLEGRGVNWRRVTDEELADFAAKALAELREAQGRS